MGESRRWVMSGVLGWLLVGIPAILLVLFVAWLSVYRFGVSGGLAYTAALVAWVIWMVWRWRRISS